MLNYIYFDSHWELINVINGLDNKETREIVEAFKSPDSF